MISIRVLGAIEVSVEGRSIALGGRRQRSLLCFLLLHANRAVSSDALIDAVWGAASPGAVKRLQMGIARLRNALEPLAGSGPSRVRTTGAGYLLSLLPGELDADVFAHGVRDGREALEGGDPARASELLAAALGLWRGPPLAEVAFEDFAQDEIRRLEELRMVALETRADAQLQLGRHTELIGELESQLAEHPARERLTGQLMTALYRSGRQADALDVYQRTRRHLAEELGLEPGPALQSLQTKVLEQAPVLDLEGLRPGSAEESRAAATPAFPSRETRLVGRQRELSELSDLLLDPDVAVLTLSGTGGTGKTSLALEVARRAVGDFAGDVVLIELASIVDPLQVDGEIVRSLEIRLTAGEPPLSGLKRALRARRMLLVLDNFEHVLDAAPALGELVDACPSLRVLVTSRAPLRIGRERVYPVSALAHPDPERHDSPAVVESYPAVALFAERARARDPEFLVTEGNAATVAALCAHLGGLPLGLELAASHADVFAPEALLDRITRTGIPAGGRSRRDAPARHATLQATIDWSHELLTAEQRSLFAAMGVFVGGFTFSAAEFVVSASPEGVLGDLEALLDQSLVQRRPGPGREARFEMLEPIRDYALERLEESGRREETLERHARYYADFADGAARGLCSGAQRSWLDALDADQANLRAVLARAEELKAIDHALRIAAGLIGYWGHRDLQREIQAWLDRVLERHSVTAVLRVKALHALGTAACWSGDFDVAQRSLEECLALVEQSDDVSMYAETEAQKARADYLARDFAGAALHRARARVLAPRGGNEWARLIVLLVLAASTDDYEESRRDSLEALTLSDALGDQIWRGWVNANLAYAALTAGDLETARHSIARGFVDAGRQGSPLLTACMAQNSAMLRLTQGDDDGATEQELTWALAVAARAGDREFIRELLNGIAAVALQTGDAERANTLAAAAEALYDHPRTPMDDLIRHGFLASLPEVALGGRDPVTGQKLTPAQIDAVIAEITAKAVRVYEPVMPRSVVDAVAMS